MKQSGTMIYFGLLVLMKAVYRRVSDWIKMVDETYRDLIEDLVNFGLDLC